MSEIIQALKIFTKFGLRRLKWITEDLEEEVFDWKMTLQSNTIRWVLTHISIVLNIFFLRATTGNLKYYPPEWPVNYLNDPTLTHQRILDDIEKGKTTVLKQLESLKTDELKETLDWYLGPQDREFYLMLLCSEILHHGGQIAAIHGNWKRVKGISLSVTPS
jgi:hypothetical protein